MISICRTHSANVKHWRDGQMALRWCAAGMVEAGKQFRRVNGHLHLRSLRDTLNKVTETVGATRKMRPSTPPENHRAATEVPRNRRARADRPGGVKIGAVAGQVDVASRTWCCEPVRNRTRELGRVPWIVASST